MDELEKMQSEETAQEQVSENAEPVTETVTEPATEEAEVPENSENDAQINVSEEKPENIPEKAENPLTRFNYYSKNTKSPASRGTKILAIVLAALIVLTGACSVGYFMGRRSITSSKTSHTEAELAKKPADTDEMTEAQVYEKVNESIVGIRVYNSKGAYADASGVIYSKEGYIVSNDHIYAEFGAPKFKVFTSDKKEYDAVYVAGDLISDLCVLKIEASGLKAAEFGDSEDVFCGEHVVAVGRPSNAAQPSSITSGVISLPKRRVKNDSNYSVNYIQTDSAINPGSSGGALSNMYGQIIGITTSKLSGNAYEGFGFAMPSAMMKRVVEDMIENGKVTKRAKLGITYTEISSVYVEINEYKTTGLLIASVTNDSDLYGKVKEGDIITHVNGEKITSDDVILNAVEESKAGDYLTLTILSTDGSSKDYSIKLMANNGESSYNPVEKTEDDEKNNSSEDSNENGDMPGGTFDFPFGR